MVHKPIKWRETMWADMEPDCYGGEACETVTPRWRTYAESDMQDGYDGDLLELSAKTFPPGTKVVISEPVCPECGAVPTRSTEPETFIGPEGGEVTEYSWKCYGHGDCDFDWRKEALDLYS